MNVMISKDDVVKVEIYDLQNHHIGTTKAFSFTDVKILFKSTGTVNVKVMSSSLPALKKGDVMILVFEYFNGNRYKTPVIVDDCDKSYFTAKVDEVEELEERRRYFKMPCKEAIYIYSERLTMGDVVPATVLNINLGGILLKCEELNLNPGDKFHASFFKGSLDLVTKVLRIQKDNEGNLVGYGCQFERVTEEQEEQISRFIMHLQVLERERRMALEDDD